MKKFIVGFLIFVVTLLLLIVVVANSSYVIKKTADAFAPDYNISYSDITGNIFSGVQIKDLKFDDMNISSEIRFSWNPSKIFYRHIAIGNIAIDNVDIETVKALISSFSSDDDNSSSSPFPFVVTVDKVHVSVMPFTEQGIRFESSVLDASNVSYAVDEIEIGNLDLKLDTNVTDIHLKAALQKDVLKIDHIDIAQVDSLALQKIFLPENNASVSSGKPATHRDHEAPTDTPLNPLVPQTVMINHLNASLKSRHYLDASIDALTVSMDDFSADIVKILKNTRGALHAGHYGLQFRSNVGDVRAEGKLKGDVLTFENLSAVKIDTQTLKAMFMPDSNETAEQNGTRTKTANDTNAGKSKEENALIPRKVIVDQLHTDMLPAVYKPVHIRHFALDAKNIVLDVERFVVEKGVLDMNGTTNLSNIKEHSIVKKNHLEGHIVLTPHQYLFDLYKLPLRKKAIGDIAMDFTASKEKLTVDMNAHAKHILLIPQIQSSADKNGTGHNNVDTNLTEQHRSKPFNIDINRVTLQGTYLFKKKKADAKVDLNVTTPYAKESTLKADFSMDDDRMRYTGIMKIGTIEGINRKLLQPVRNLEVHVKGDEKQLATTIDAQDLKGYFNVPDFSKSGMFHLETKTPVEVSRMISLPDELNATKINAVVDVPLNFQHLVPIKGKARIDSNVANIKADLVYGGKTHLKVVTAVPQDSLLRKFDKKIQWEAISPLTLDVNLGKKDITARLKSNQLAATMKMEPFDGKVTGNVRLAGMTTTLDGTVPGNIVIHSNVSSFHTLLNTVNTFYTMDTLPKVKGKLDLSLIVTENNEVYLTLLSPQIIYAADRQTTNVIDDVSMIFRKKGGKIALSSYHAIYNDIPFYSSKPSVVNFKKDMITVPQFWLNNQLKVTGDINLKTLQGKLDANAQTFHFSNDLIDLDSKIDLEAILDGNRTNLKGKVSLLDGNIHYDLNTKTFPSDSDIVIVQDMKQDRNSTFMDNLTMHINVDSKKPLVYKQGPADIRATLDLAIHKEINSDPMLIGSVDIVDGSSYMLQEKKFILEHSHIYFTGDPAKPVLDLRVKYKALKHVITIVITGTPTMPNILFSSVPYLSREQILSLILFDSEEAADTNNADEMMKMMGGAMAKAALNDLGVKIDHLVIGEGNSVEVGKKLTDKITIIYINGEIPKMEVKYEYNPSVEVVVGASEESESIDVVYRKDFNLKKDDDIVVKRKNK